MSVYILGIMNTCLGKEGASVLIHNLRRQALWKIMCVGSAAVWGYVK